MNSSENNHPLENVGEYPRPPRIERISISARIWLGAALICDATEVVRVLETFHPPGIYIPRAAFAAGVLQPAADARGTWCEFKGAASYLDLHGPDAVVLERAAWSYPAPTAGYELLADLIAVYPARMTRCTLDGEDVIAQPGDFYGGWTTTWITGPIKGAPGTTHW